MSRMSGHALWGQLVQGVSVWVTLFILAGAFLHLRACTFDEADISLSEFRPAPAEAIPAFVRIPRPLYVNAITAAPDKSSLVAVGDEGLLVRSSDGGQTWSAPAAPGVGADLGGVIATSTHSLLAWGHTAVLRSVDNGVSWSAITKSDTTPLRAGAPVEVPGGSLIAVGSFGAIVRSTDGGASWSKSYERPGTDNLNSLCVHPSGGVIGVGDNGLIVRSSDKGASWSEVEDSGINQTLKHVVAGPDGALVAVGNGIVRSTDGGKSWSSVRKGKPAWYKVAPFSDKVMVAVGEAIARSADGGVTWSVVDHDDGPFYEVLADPSGNLLALGWNGLIKRSADGGASWSTIQRASPAHRNRRIFMTPDGVLLSAGSGPIKRSIDLARGWHDTRAPGLAGWRAHSGTGTFHALNGFVAYPDGTLVAVGVAGAIVRSTDHGASWTNIDNPSTNDLVSLTRVPSGDLIAVGQHGMLLRSSDKGKSWKDLSDGLSGQFLRDVVAGPGGVVVAVGQMIARSADSGANWEAVPHKGNVLDLNSVVMTPGKTLVAVGADRSSARSLVVRSTDGGASWTQVEDMPSGLGLSRVVVESGGALIAVGRAGQVVRSTDDGRSWVLAVRSVNMSDLDDLLAGADGLLLAVGKKGTIIRSSDGGQHWVQAQGTERVDSDLTSISAEQGGTLMAVGEKATILRSNDRGASWSSIPTNESETFRSVGAAGNGHMLAIGGGHSYYELISLDSSGLAFMMRGSPSKAMAPSIRYIAHAYSINDAPMLRLTLSDPSNLCGAGDCITVRARSSADHKTGAPLRKLEDTVYSAGDGEYTITIDPTLLSANRPDPVFVQVRLAGAGFSRVYPSGDAFFEIPNGGEPIYERAWFMTLAAAAGVMLLLYATLMLRPLWLLGLAARPALLDAVPKAGFPGVGDMIAGLVGALILPVLSRQARVLDAWVERHGCSFADAFDTAVESAAEKGVPYTPLPIDGPERDHIIPSPATIAPYFDEDRSFVQIVGQGGVGKTMLALEIGRWLHEGALTHHIAAVLYIDEEFTDLFAVVQAKISAMLAEQVPPEFLRALLATGRLWLIIDRVSERTLATREAVTNLYRTVSVKAVIATTRFGIDVDGQKVTVLRPRALDSTTLLGFLEAQLVSFHSLELFPRLGDQSVLIAKLARQITVNNEELAITPLLVRVFIGRAVELVRAHGIRGLDMMPDSVPEAYFNYVERLDASKRKAEADAGIAPELLRRAAVIAAYVELGGDFRPKQVAGRLVEEALRADPRLAAAGIDFLQRLDANGLIVRRVHGTETTAEYLLDPLAECLAAFEYARMCGASAEHWASLIEEVARRGPACRGFMLALRMNHAAYRDALRFPPVEFPADLQISASTATAL